MSEPRFDVAETIGKCLASIRRSIPRIGTQHPRIGDGTSAKYLYCETDDWVEGFWPGQLWLGHAASSEAVFRVAAEAFRPYFAGRLNRAESYSHDFGFLYTLSCVAEYTLTGHTEARDIALRAAEILLDRFNPNGRFIQAWNENAETARQKYPNRGKMIIDCMENLPLLFWASRVTGKTAYAEAAIAHANSTRDHLIRADFSTGHTFNFDPDSGEPLAINTHQGFSDESCWARGQAWAVHGFACLYLNTGDIAWLETARKLADYAVSRLPEDGVSVWDFDLPADQPQYVDTSAAAIFAAGFLLLDGLAEGGGKYRERAATILNTLTREHALLDDREADGLLLHGASHVAKGRADNMLPYGDYYYLEALLRLQGAKGFFW